MKNTARLLKVITHLGALLPLALLVWDYYTDRLGADPIREITLRTGLPALVLLILSLACTPLNIWLGWKQLLPLRRPLGLYAFLYVCLHLLTFVVIDYGLEPQLIGEAIFEKRYALAGFSAFLLLLPLALTSNQWSMRKLGKNWKKLHRLVYPAGLLAIVHFFWLVKHTYVRPTLFGLVLLLLLLTRLTPIKQRILRWRQGGRGASRPGKPPISLTQRQS